MAGSYLDAEDLHIANVEENKKQTWRDLYATMPQFPQRQDSTQEQLQDLYKVANKLGFYDAADFLKSYI